MEDESVKFLQEAAIMGQFRHPNIVRLHGVVTMGEPVSAVSTLQYMAVVDLLQVHLGLLQGDDCVGTDGEWRPQEIPTLT